MTEFSIVIATRGRPVECDRAWRSVVAHFPGTQLIVVEQQSDVGNYPVGADFPGTWIRQTGRGVSRARNRGLAEVESSSVLFLDDDARAVPTLTDLIHVHEIAGSAATAGRVRFLPSGRLTRGDRSAELTPTTVGRCFVESATIFKTAALRDLGGFDERLGVGVDFGAEEGAAVLACLAESQDSPLLYAPIVVCEHPDVDAPPPAKARSYGRGVGALIPLHPTSWWIWRYVVFITARSAVGSLVFLARGDAASARPRWSWLRGVAGGLVAALAQRRRALAARRIDHE